MHVSASSIFPFQYNEDEEKERERVRKKKRLDALEAQWLVSRISQPKVLTYSLGSLRIDSIHTMTLLGHIIGARHHPIEI